MDEQLENQEKKQRRRQLRQKFSTTGWAMMIYLLVLNACVMIAMIVDMVVMGLRQMSGEVLTEAQISGILYGNGWGYLVTIAIGLIALRLWKGKTFCTQTLWTRGRPMKLGDFLCQVCVLISAQAAFQVISGVLEGILNQFGFSALGDYETATMTADSLSMWLYGCVGAPIAEEILFRGLVLRQLEPHGKRFAIVMSAVMFGVFHANLVQIPYAILVGLLLGYVAVEYNIAWAMLLHMINNLALGDLLDRLTRGLSDTLSYMVVMIVIWGCALAAAIILIVRRKEAGEYRRNDPIAGEKAGCFLTSPGILAVFIYAAVTVVSNFVAYNI